MYRIIKGEYLITQMRRRLEFFILHLARLGIRPFGPLFDRWDRARVACSGGALKLWVFELPKRVMPVKW